MKFFIVFFVIFYIGCKKSNSKKEIFKDYFEVNIYNNLNKLEGVCKRYTLNGNLIKETTYSNGVKNGKEIEYLNNGKKIYESNYYYGLLDGYQFIYDDNEEIEVKINYYYDKVFGSSYYYKDKNLTYYYYYDFTEKQDLFIAKYENGKLVAFNGSPLRASKKDLIEENVIKSKLFISIIKPPQVKVNYYIGIEDSLFRKQILGEIKTDKQFIDTILEKKDNYFVQLDYEDTINKIKKVYYEIFQKKNSY